MIAETLRYEADGLNMEGEFYADDTKAGPRPGVLVFPEGFGLGPHTKSRAKRLAEIGYAALACDLFGEGSMKSLDVGMPIIQRLREDCMATRARARGALETLLTRPEVDKTRIAAIGFCFGGTMALELARSGADIRGIVGFHSGLSTTAPEDARNIKGKVLVCIGAEDPAVDSDQRTAFEKEMREAGVNWQMNLYGGVRHSFTNPEADKLGMPQMARYDAQADRRSWAEMRAFFEEIFA